jgi:Domain of unknown function (DUF6306)
MARRARPREAAMADEPGEFASPACFMREADDAYMGYAAPCELIEALNEILEAERGLARAARKTAAELTDAGLRELAASIRRDGGRHRRLLARAIAARGGAPSKASGAFYAQTISFADPLFRLAALDRDLRAAAGKLREVTPRIRDQALAGELSAMRVSHEDAAAKIEGRLSA